MNYKYITTMPPKAIDCLLEDEPVLINPDKLRFCLLNSPSINDIHRAIDEHLHARSNLHWAYLMGQVKGYTASGKRGKHLPHDTIRLLIVDQNTMRFVKDAGPILEALGTSHINKIYERTKKLSVQQQQALVASIRPTTKDNVLSLYRSVPPNDHLGHIYLTNLVQGSADAVEFFGKLTEDLFTNIESADFQKGRLSGFRKARLLEFLGLALGKGWLLFPFVHKSSFLPQHLLLLHRNNVAYHFASEFVGSDFNHLMALVTDNSKNEHTATKYKVFARTLMQCSTYRRLSQTSSELFNFYIDNIGNLSKGQRAQELRAPTFCNLLVNLFNATHDYPDKKIPLIIAERHNMSSPQEYASFKWLTDRNPEFTQWREAFEKYVVAVNDSQFDHRRIACRHLGEFLLGIDDAPLSPDKMPRHLINDYEDDSNTFRNYLKTKGTNDRANRALQLLAPFFDWYCDLLMKGNCGRVQSEYHFSNPINIRRDSFSTVYRAGSTRRAIQSEIMDTMRMILVEDDYRWPKENFKADYGSFANKIEGGFERNVWCPSTAILLHTLLSVPLRGLQGQLLDSGEGDDTIFDFQSRKMIPNRARIKTGGATGQKAEGRREGLVQVIPSGMLGQEDIIGLWITTNKISGEGYYIPWVSEELLKHIEYQYNWIMRYAPYPSEPRGRSAAKGTHTQPKHFVDQEAKFFCLFRDPTVKQKSDPHSPVSKQKLNKLWGLLCAETQRRINANAKPGEERVVLVDDVNAEHPRAKFDIHSLRVSGITDLLDRGVPLNIVSEYVAGHATYIMTLWYDKPSPFKVREYLRRAKERIGDIDSAFPQFSIEELDDYKEFLISHPDYKNLYTGFDALEDNGGLFLHKQSGICPATRCEEGALDDKGRPTHVPMGDRGPSCPQCRFWLTGPAFLLGQVIEGNQLIRKIRIKVQALSKLRDKILDAEDAGNRRQANIFAGQADTEERQLNDMLTEWWHRMRFYEASIRKLDEYNERVRSKDTFQQEGNGDEKLQLFTRATQGEIECSFERASDIELAHFLSTVSEFFPEFISSEESSSQDIENAVGKILALNDSDMAKLYFKLNDDQRLTAANLAMSLMLESVGPGTTSQIIDASVVLKDIPQLDGRLSLLLDEAIKKPFTLPNFSASKANRFVQLKEVRHE